MSIDASRYARERRFSNCRYFTMFLFTLLLFFFFFFFAEKTLQQDMLDFLQGARGQDFYDITLMVDGEAIGAHKVREYSLLR